MTKIHRHLFLTTTFILIASLAACGRPSVRSNKVVPTAPATSSSPAKAEQENKDADAADAVSAEATAAAKELGAGTSDSSADSPTAQVTEAKKAARTAALDQVAKLFADDGKPGDVKPGETAAPVTPVVTPAADATGTTNPVAADGAKPDAAKEDLAIQVMDMKTVPEPAAIAAIQFEAAVKRTFILGLIEPSMRLNNAVALQRIELERLKKKMDAKQELTKEETAWFEKLKMDYGIVDSKATVEQTLERVDTVQLSFLSAPLAIKTGWGTLGGVQKDLLSKRMEELNTSTGDSKSRFRTTRADLRHGKKTGTVEGIELMQSFLGADGAQATASNKLLMETTGEIARLLSEPEATQEIERVRMELVRENTPAQLRN